MAVESDAEFLARLRPPFITRADRSRLFRMMADEARALGDVEAAERLAPGCPESCGTIAG